MKISVIITHINRDKMLEMCLEAFEVQKLPKEDYEVIVVGSLSEELSSKAKFSIKHIPYVLEEGEKYPLSFLRNLGAKEAGGQILVFLDCDMVVSRDFLQNVWSQLSAESKLLFALRKKVPENVEVNSIQELKHIKCEKDERELICSLFESDYSKIKSIWLWAYGYTMSLRKEDFFRAGMFSEQFKGWGLEDTELSYRIYKMGIPIDCDVKSKCYHLWHPENFDNKRYKAYQENLRVFRAMHKEPVLQGMDICERCISPSMGVKLATRNIPQIVYCLSLFETYIRGFYDGFEGKCKSDGSI